MPLLLFCGFPSSGKSVWANVLKDKLEKKIASLESGSPGYNYKVILHSDESLGITHEMYRESTTEKSARAMQMSAVKRDISRNNIVILDTMSYNKGFRYQLFCESKSANTSQVLLQVMCPTDECFKLNNKRKGAEKWADDLLAQMIARYEEPDGSKRWDSPLISVAFDEHNPNEEEELVNKVWEILVLQKVAKPNQATILKPATSGNYLHELDRLTQKVVASVIAHMQLGIGGDAPIEGEPDVVVSLPQHSVSPAQLQRTRRAFIMLNRARPLDTGRIVPLFAQYLENALASE
ncbi:hypothetical protein CANINC_000512 [Pichia inconspicua]|uniref:Chromatin associated protein KTI12 n=1 Tax=Pichia inconspicua TaxID=52247 RepID=A0A4V4NG75_9ASCO|nr:hypothetical protein CANINC_000512 [[Candida] inconspicua]